MNRNDSSGSWMILVALYFIIFLPSVNSQADSVTEKSLLWEISGNGLAEPSHLFGTLHVLKESHLKTWPHVLEAYSAAEGVVVEIVMDTAELVQSLSAMYMPDNSLPDLYAPEDYQRLSKQFSEVTGQPLSIMNQLKPNAVMVQLMQATTSKIIDSLAPSTGNLLDVFFVEQGKKDHKNIQALESIALQMDVLFNNPPLEEQAAGLEWILKNIPAVKEVQEELIEHYLAQELKGLGLLMEKMPAGFSLGLNDEDLLDERNANWMKQLPGMMEEGPQFVAVGALHLVGEQGLVNQLREAGYTVQPVYK